MTAMSPALKPMRAASMSVYANNDDGPDAEVKEFRLDDLKATLGTMQPSPERNYFAGVLANWTGQIDDSIRLLLDALPSVRKSNSARAAVALETLADDCNKKFPYEDSDLTTRIC
jgi:hypothetical protein